MASRPRRLPRQRSSAPPPTEDLDVLEEAEEFDDEAEDEEEDEDIKVTIDKQHGGYHEGIFTTMAG